MKTQIVINGRGGQGVLFLTSIISKVAIKKGFNVRVSETHGMAQRGGSVVSFIKIGEFFSPMIIPSDADFLICLHEEEFDNGRGYLKDSGRFYVNSSKSFDATSLSLKMGNPKMANVVFLGYVARDEDFVFSYSDFLEVLPSETIKYFKAGYELDNWRKL